MLRFIERTLTSLVFSILLMLGSFSFMTGKFPPAKQDLLKAYALVKEMVSSTPKIKAEGESLQAQINSGKEPNLEQMAKYQELALRRTQVGLELLKLYPKIQMAPGQEEIQLRLDNITNHLGEIDKELNTISIALKRTAQQE